MSSMEGQGDLGTTKEFHRFTELPTEIRLMIYKVLLSQPEGIYINTKVRGHFEACAKLSEPCAVLGSCKGQIFRKKKRRCVCPPVFPKGYSVENSILGSCKWVRNEALDIFWKQKWHFANPETLHAFLMLLKPETIGHINDITIHKDLNKRDIRHFAFLAPLRYATHLQVLRFGGSIDAHPIGSFSEERNGWIIAQIFFRKFAPFVRAFVALRGVEDLLGVVKFHQIDMGGKLLLGAWNDEKERDFFKGLKKGLKECLVDLLHFRDLRSRL
ncbi:hypothetical protein N0V93_008648 [Gnomoniopsis smithogilvyi]|uniref:2EXR domain-containing protein n=1 Tax=Gnomoniopsis smithogilvyi TaxID=1191159 RepID=A0A9W8YPJ2_9PEZI|nr:hypothetical protein N0V93_008648 [Gnomoniopsis smithogilvyi]